MRRNWSRSVLSLWLAAQLAATGCQPPAAVQAPKQTHAAPAPLAPPPAPAGRPEVALPADPTLPTGALTLDLTSAPPAVGAATPTPLPQAETDALLARLEPLPDVGARPAPIVRPATAAPPRQGPATPIAFAAPTGKQIADVPAGASQVAPLPLVPPDIQPSGEIRQDSEIRLRFDEPMIAVGAVGNALPDAAHAPATITPAVAGTWRWIDTRVATFTAAAPRLPMATDFTITVPAGTRALSGATLAADATQKFSTPGPSISGLYPTGWSTRIRPDSPIVIELDQEVDADAIAPFLSVVDRGTKQKLAFTRTTLEAARPLWAKNPSLKPKDLERVGAHTLVIAPKTAWPAGANLFVRLAAGAPAKDGPRKAARESGSEINVAKRFVLAGITCDEHPARFDPTCSAASWLQVELSNAIDRSTYHSSMIQVAGRPLVDHAPQGEGVYLDVPDVVGRSFTIAVAKTGISDIYGQPLASPRDLGFTTSRERYQPYLWAHETGMFILDPRFAQPQWVVDAQAIESLHVELYRAEPGDYFAYHAFESGSRKTPPGKKVFDKVYEVGKRSGSQLRQDLTPALDASGTGHVIAVVRAAEVGKRPDLAAHAWIQVTKLGITARFDKEKVSAWVESIAPTSTFLSPVASAQAQLIVEARSDVPAAVATDARGAATFSLPEPLPRKTDDEAPPEHEALLVAKAGADSVFTAIDTAEKSQRRDFARWYVTDDRFTYKPGEPVYVKGWLRWTHDGVNPDIAMPTAGATVSYALIDGRGNKLASGTAALTDQGGFDLVAQIPANASLGSARFSFTTPVPGHPDQQSTYDHRIAVQEFRTPAFAVTLDDDVGHSGTLPVIAGESIEMLAAAKYYAGGGLGGAGVKWNAQLSPAMFHPPGWDDFSFAPIRKRSDDDNYWRRSHAREGNGTELVETSKLSAASDSRVTLGIPAVPYGEPATLSVDATVTDLDRQTIRSSSRAIVVHPSAYYVGLRQKHDDDNLMTGELLAIATDIDGKPVIGVPIEIDIEGVLGSELWRDDAKVIDTQHCTVKSAAEPVACPYRRKDVQTAYKAVARIADRRGRKNGAQYQIPWWSPDRNAELSITTDRTTYRVGDTAKLVIHSATVPANATVTFARQGVISQQRVELKEEATPIEVPIEPGFVENVHVLVDRWSKRKDVRVKTNTDPLPEHRSIGTDLAVDLDSVRLAMTTRPLQAIVEPGASASFEVTVKHDGKPVANAEVALLAVDEAVLALSSRTHQDPLPEFYAKVGDGTREHDTLGLVNDAGEDLAGKPGFERWSLDTLGHGFGTGSGYGVGGGRGGMSGRTAAVPSLMVAGIETRKDFRATAAWSPRLHTDANGKATLTVKMPDNLTRYRIVALATATGRWFGKAENTIVAQLPINARTVAPRFLTQGDTFALPVVVQNLDSRARTIDVAVRAANLTTAGIAGQRVTVPAGQRAEVRFQLATVARGTAAIQTIARANGRIDANTVEVPVYEPATTESFATYGVIDDKPAFERLAVPNDIFPEVGGVEAELSSTQLQTLTDAYWYLYAYPYECAEQRSARMLATSAVADILEAFQSPGRPKRAVLEQQRIADLAKLAKDQNGDGGWNFYPGMKSDPFITQQVLAAFAAGPGGDGNAKTKAIDYVTRDVTTRLAGLEKRARLPLIDRKARDQEPYDVGVVAAELATLAAAGADAVPRARRLHAAALALDAYPIDAKARLLALVAGRAQDAAIRKRLVADVLSNVHETAAGATVTVKAVESERLLFTSNAKTTSLALAALIRESPQLPVIEKLAHGVLEARAHGRWLTTQENLVVLQTMRRYFDTYEKQTPSYTGKLWFGTAAYAEQTFAGRSSERARVSLTWPDLGAGSTHDVALDKAGPGRMYYRIGITYAPKQRDLPALDAGFIVRRSYAAVDDPGDVVRGADGTWTIKLGARVLVQLEVVNTTRRNVVGLVDPLPAGFEAVNTALATAERAATGTTSSDWNHIMMRDNRAEAFAFSLAEGTHRFSYTARATTPGTFLAAPTKAEEMYAPETFGRSGGGTVVIR